MHHHDALPFFIQSYPSPPSLVVWTARKRQATDNRDMITNRCSRSRSLFSSALRNPRFFLRTASIPIRCLSLADEDARPLNIIDDLHVLPKIPLEDVRNFCFISHVDHGKSSLSSRILELTGNQGRKAQLQALGLNDDNAAAVEQADSKEQIEVLDSLAVEQERGITVKASAASLLYHHESAVGPTGTLLINIYDTPGHADFGKEVLRSLQFVQGAFLLVDATQGMQAQTWSVYQQAKSLDRPPKILLALTKTDLELAKPLEVALQVSEWLDYDDPDSILLTSARKRIGIKEILDTVCEQVPPPPALDDKKLLRAQVVDSWYDDRGVNCLLQIVEGEVKETDRVALVSDSSKQSFSVQECGILLPRPQRTGKLIRGQMGYCRFGLKNPREALPGTILMHHEDIAKSVELPPALLGLSDGTRQQSVLYASVHPQDVGGFDDLCNAVNRLALNDTGLEVSRTGALDGDGAGERGGPFLGPGLRVGFQGLLHVEVFQQRLRDEFGIDAVVTPPKVTYNVTYLPSSRTRFSEPYTVVIEDLAEWPEPGARVKIEEPIVQVKIMAPVEHTGAVMDLLQRKRGIDLETKPLDETQWLFTARVPWAEVSL